MSFKISSMKSQMRLANKLNAKNVLILGEDELNNNCVTVKDMSTSEQQSVTMDDNFKEIITMIKER